MLKKKLSKLSKYELTLYAQHNMKMNEEREKMEMKMESGQSTNVEKQQFC